MLLSAAMSVDGYLDDAGPTRLLLSSAEDFDQVDEVRAGVDAILVGAGTVRADNPRLLVRSERRRRERERRGLPGNPAKVTLSGSGNLDPAAAFFTEGDVERLERACDEYNARLPKLTSFVLPGGTPGAALLHVARTVTRRAERSAWHLLEADPERTNPTPARYLNRLSDLLFILARSANPDGDVLWRPGGNR